jgi:hypothetical protein
MAYILALEGLAYCCGKDRFMSRFFQFSSDGVHTPSSVALCAIAMGAYLDGARRTRYS